MGMLMAWTHFFSKLISAGVSRVTCALPAGSGIGVAARIEKAFDVCVFYGIIIDYSGIAAVYV